MIAGIFHEGSGLGDQLFRYITVRTLAEEKGWGFGMCNYDYFKGSDFIPLDTGIQIGSPEAMYYEDGNIKNGFEKWEEKDVRDAQGNDIRSYDPEINFVKDRTVIDGSFEDSKYWHHNLANISKWLAVEPLHVPDDVCVIGFRGGEYALQPDLFLTKEYYEKAMQKVSKFHEHMTSEVHTDDPILAESFFSDPQFKDYFFAEAKFHIVNNKQISHSKHTNMALNWRSARYAKYAIIPNSAFFILPRLLKHLEDPTAVTIAPRFWARRNTTGPWRPATYYKEFLYI